jgi:hypothetical protein
MAGVLDGSEPLQRAQNSGGLQATVSPDFKTRMFGAQSRISALGVRRSIPAENLVQYVQGGLWYKNESLAMMFKKFSTFMMTSQQSINIREAKKEQQEAGGFGGIVGKLRKFAPHFFDYKILKKLTGQTMNPQLDSINQIRDMLIEQFDEGGGKGYKAKFGQDPKDMMFLIPSVLEGLKKYGAKSGSMIGGVTGLLKEGLGEVGVGTGSGTGMGKVFEFVEDIGNPLEKFVNAGLKKGSIYTHDMYVEDALKNLNSTQRGIAEQADIQFKDSEFDKFKADSEKKKEKKSGGIIGILMASLAAIGGVISGLFHKVVGNLVTKLLGPLMSNIPSLLSKMGPLLSKFGPALGFGAVAGGLVAHDITRKGGASDQWKQGNKLEAVRTGAFGKRIGDMTPKEMALEYGKNSLKWASAGAAVGSVVPGVGTGVGAAAGKMVGDVGFGLSAATDKKFVKRWTGLMKGSKITASHLPMLALMGPAAIPMGLLGLTAMAYAEKQIKKQTGFDKWYKTTIEDGIIGPVKKYLVGIPVIKFATDIFDQLKKFVEGIFAAIKEKLGGAIGGVLEFFGLKEKDLDKMSPEDMGSKLSKFREELKTKDISSMKPEEQAKYVQHVRKEVERNNAALGIKEGSSGYIKDAKVRDQLKTLVKEQTSTLDTLKPAIEKFNKNAELERQQMLQITLLKTFNGLASGFENLAGVMKSKKNVVVTAPNNKKSTPATVED